MDKASRTAELAALARASHTKEPDAIRGADTMAIGFLRRRLRAVVEIEPLRRAVLRVMARRMPGVYGFVLARTKVFDEFVERELAAGATQLVVLGAGYDSRAYRFRALLESRGARVFEVDSPPTSEQKQARLRAVLGSAPAHVAYVKVDFDRETMEDPLLAAGYDPTARTAFLWEGVTFYLTSGAVETVLEFVARASGEGSAIVFDYLFASVLDGTSRAFGAAENVAYVRRKGEPFTFGLEPAELRDFVAARGLTLEEDLGPAELEAYAGDLASKPTHRLAGFYGIATARRVAER
jgi:methyltransferase (TIGR00027 family)